MFLRSKKATHLTDEDLVAKLRSRDKSALAALWDRYAHLLFGVAMKYLKNTDAAKDAVMEVFADMPALVRKHEVQRFRPWVHTVMRNRCLMMLRKKDPQLALDPERLPQVMPSNDAVLHEASLQALETAIRQLPDGQESCIRLFYLERMSYQQVAERTGIPLEQVRSNLQNGRRNLRNSLQRNGHEN